MYSGLGLGRSGFSRADFFFEYIFYYYITIY